MCSYSQLPITFNISSDIVISRTLIVCLPLSTQMYHIVSTRRSQPLKCATYVGLSTPKGSLFFPWGLVVVRWLVCMDVKFVLWSLLGSICQVLSPYFCRCQYLASSALWLETILDISHRMTSHLGSSHSWWRSWLMGHSLSKYIQTWLQVLFLAHSTKIVRSFVNISDDTAHLYIRQPLRIILTGIQGDLVLKCMNDSCVFWLCKCILNPRIYHVRIFFIEP